MTTNGTTNDNDNDWQRVITKDDKRQRVTANDSKWSFRLKFFSCQQCDVGMNILKTKRSFLITSEAIANNSSRCIQTLKIIPSLSLYVPLVCLCISDLRELCKRYPQLITEDCIEMQSGTSAVHVFFIWSNQFYVSDIQF